MWIYMWIQLQPSVFSMWATECLPACQAEEAKVPTPEQEQLGALQRQLAEAMAKIQAMEANNAAKVSQEVPVPTAPPKTPAASASGPPKEKEPEAAATTPASTDDDTIVSPVGNKVS